MIVPEIKDPVIRYPATSTGGIVYRLPNSGPDYNFNEHDFEILKSVINGHKEIVSTGVYFKGNVTVLGLAYNDYLVYQNMIGQVVRFWPFGSGFISTGVYYPYVDCIVTNVIPFRESTKLYLDACVIYLESQDEYVLHLATSSGLPPPA